MSRTPTTAATAHHDWLLQGAKLRLRTAADEVRRCLRAYEDAGRLNHPTDGQWEALGAALGHMRDVQEALRLLAGPPRLPSLQAATPQARDASLAAVRPLGGSLIPRLRSSAEDREVRR